MDCTRREMLGLMGGAAVTTGLVALTGESLAATEEVWSEGKNGHFKQLDGEFGWKPHTLDPKASGPVAYEGYYYKGLGCGYGAFYGIIGMMGEKYGAPYKNFPFTMLESVKAGISGWGTICGALYGAVAAFSLFYGRKERDAMVDELFRWYETTALPIYKPGDIARVKEDVPANKSDSVLCHVSVGKWSYLNKQPQDGKLRSERCGRLTADVCMKAIEILNAKIEAGANWKGVLAKQDSVKKCGVCHNKKMPATDWNKSKQDCAPCHGGNKHLGNKFENHPE